MVELRLEQRMEQKPSDVAEGERRVYNICVEKPNRLRGGEVTLYFTHFDLTKEPVVIIVGENLDDAIAKLVETEEVQKLGMNMTVVSYGCVELTEGDGFFGYDPFPAYPIPHEALMRFAQLRTKQWRKDLGHEIVEWKPDEECISQLAEWIAGHDSLIDSFKERYDKTYTPREILEEMKEGTHIGKKRHKTWQNFFRDLGEIEEEHLSEYIEMICAGIIDEK